MSNFDKLLENWARKPLGKLDDYNSLRSDPKTVATLIEKYAKNLPEKLTEDDIKLSKEDQDYIDMLHKRNIYFFTNKKETNNG